MRPLSRKNQLQRGSNPQFSRAIRFPNSISLKNFPHFRAETLLTIGEPHFFGYHLPLMPLPTENLPDAEPPRELADLKRSEPKAHAVGSAAVISSLAEIHTHTNPVRGGQALLKMNQKGGFDCPSCAWADPDGKRSPSEFCENGAKAVATEITDRRADAEFFAKHSVVDLAKESDFWLNDAGRITEPFLLEEGSHPLHPHQLGRRFRGDGR